MHLSTIPRKPSKINFYGELKGAVEMINRHEMLIITGDSTAKVSNDPDP